MVSHKRSRRKATKLPNWVAKKIIPSLPTRHLCTEAFCMPGESSSHMLCDIHTLCRHAAVTVVITDTKCLRSYLWPVATMRKYYTTYKLHAKPSLLCFQCIQRTDTWKVGVASIPCSSPCVLLLQLPDHTKEGVGASHSSCLTRLLSLLQAPAAQAESLPNSCTNLSLTGSESNEKRNSSLPLHSCHKVCLHRSVLPLAF